MTDKPEHLTSEAVTDAMIAAGLLAVEDRAYAQVCEDDVVAIYLAMTASRPVEDWICTEAGEPGTWKTYRPVGWRDEVNSRGESIYGASRPVDAEQGLARKPAKSGDEA